MFVYLSLSVCLVSLLICVIWNISVFDCYIISDVCDVTDRNGMRLLALLYLG